MYEEEPEVSEAEEEGVKGIISESRSEKKWGHSILVLQEQNKGFGIIYTSREVCDACCAEE